MRDDPEKIVCGICGTAYEGRACPTCAIKSSIEESTAALLAAQELESARKDARAAALAAVQRDIAAQQWSLQAEAKTSRAIELFKAEAYPEALHLLEQALAQDPSYLWAYAWASLTYLRIGDSAAAQRCASRHIALLRAEPWDQDWDYLYLALVPLASGSNLLSTLIAEVRRSIGTRTNGDWLSVAEDLLKRGFIEEAARLTSWGLGNRQTPPLSAFRRLLGSFKDHDRDDVVTDLIEQVLARKPSFETHAVHLEMTDQSPKALEKLSAYLSAEEYERQNELMRAFHAFLAERPNVEPGSLMAIKTKVRNSYSDWLPDRIKRIEALADHEARSRATTYALFLGVGLGAVFFVVVFLIVASMKPDAGCGALFLIAIISALIVWVVFNWRRENTPSAGYSEFLERYKDQEAAWARSIGFEAKPM